MEKALRVIKDMARQGIIKAYAIGGGNGILEFFGLTDKFKKFEKQIDEK